MTIFSILSLIFQFMCDHPKTGVLEGKKHLFWFNGLMRLGNRQSVIFLSETKSLENLNVFPYPYRYYSSKTDEYMSSENYFSCRINLKKHTFWFIFGTIRVQFLLQKNFDLWAKIST